MFIVVVKSVKEQSGNTFTFTIKSTQASYTPHEYLDARTPEKIPLVVSPTGNSSQRGRLVSRE